MSEMKKPISNSRLVLREEFDDWAILFDPDTGHAFGMNPTAVLIWKHLDGSRTEEEIVRIVGERCENVPHDVRKDLAEFLLDMVKKGYIGYEM